MKNALKIFIIILTLLFVKTENQEWVNMKFKYVKSKNLDPNLLELNKCYVKPYP